MQVEEKRPLASGYYIKGKDKRKKGREKKKCEVASLVFPAEASHITKIQPAKYVLKQKLQNC